ncbi:MAG: hypothetical protein QXG00_04420 [Candidatus Woesearchaeota archaeon]
MSRILLIMTTFSIFMLSFAVAMGKIAESSANKVLVFSEDMNNAIDCAIRAIPIEKCSPNLMNYTFNPDINEFKRITQNLTMNLDEINQVEIKNYNNKNQNNSINNKMNNVDTSNIDKSNIPPVIVIIG